MHFVNTDEARKSFLIQRLLHRLHPLFLSLSSQVLELFCDNFDYEDLPTFIRGVLQDEIRGDKLYSHVLTNEYAARVTNLRMYDAVRYVGRNFFCCLFSFATQNPGFPSLPIHDAV